MKQFTFIPQTIILCLSLLVTACSPSKTSEQYQQLAIESIDKKAYKEAIIDLKNALSQEPSNSKSRFLLGQSYLYAGEVGGAEKELTRAKELDYDINQIMPLLIRAQLFLAKMDELQASLSLVNELHPLVALEVKSIAGIGLTSIGEEQFGMQQLASVLQSPETENFYYKIAKAWVAANNGQLDLAINSVEEIQQKDSSFNDAQLMLGQLYFLNKEYAQASEIFESYLQKHSFNYLVRTNLVAVYIQQDELEKAEAQVDNMLARFPNSPLVNEYKAEIKLRSGNYKEASEHASIAVTGQPNLFKANLIAGLSFYQLNNYEMALHHLANVETRLPPNHLGSQTLTQVKLKLGYLDEALANIDAINALSEQDFNLLANASLALMRNGDESKAKQYIDRMDSIDTSNVQTMSKRGLFKLSINDQTGLDDLNKAIELDPEYEQARIALLQNYLRNGQQDKAMQVANKWIMDLPKHESGYLAKGVVWQSQGNNEQAKVMFEKAISINENSAGALFNLGVIAYKEQQYSLAFKNVEQLLVNHRQHRGGHALLINLAPNLEDNLAAIALTDSLLSKEPESVELHILKAKVNDKLGNSELALTDLKEIVQQAQDNIQYLNEYARLGLKVEDFKLAEETFNKLIAINSNQLSYHIGLLIALEGQSKYQQAFTEVKKAQQRFRDKEGLKLYEAKYLLKTKAYNQAKMVLDGTEKNQVDEKVYLSLLYDYQMKVNNYQGAKESANNWNNKYPSLASSIAYIRSLQVLNENAEAINETQKAATKYGNNGVLDNLLAELQVKESPEKSLQYYQKVVSENPDNFIALNNLAWSAIMANNTQLGLESAQKAAKLAPEQPQVMDTLAVAHMRTGNYQQAKTILDKVQKLLPNDNEVKLHFAEVLVHLKDFSEAEKVLAAVPENSEKDKVVALLAQARSE